MATKKIVRFFITDMASAWFLVGVYWLLKKMPDIRVKVYVGKGGKAPDILNRYGMSEYIHYRVLNPNDSYFWQECVTKWRKKHALFVLGCGKPAELETRAGIAANQRGIPVLALEDLPGTAFGRLSGVNLDAITTIDTAASGYYPDMTSSVVGNPNIPQHQPDSSHEAQEFVGAQGVFPVFFSVQAGRYTNIKLMAMCLARTPGARVIIGIHPKQRETEVNGEPLAKYAQRIFEAEAPEQWVMQPEGILSDHISTDNRVWTASFDSGLLALGVRYGRGGVVIQPEGVENTSHYTLLGVRTVRTPVNLRETLPGTSRIDLEPYNPQALLEAILSLV